jgi:hypothetical protein
VVVTQTDDRPANPPRGNVADRLRSREEWKFFAVLPRASRGLCCAWWALMARGGRYAELYGIQAAAFHAGYQTTGNPEKAGDLNSL